jgi:hypothetical protein
LGRRRSPAGEGRETRVGNETDIFLLVFSPISQFYKLIKHREPVLSIFIVTGPCPKGVEVLDTCLFDWMKVTWEWQIIDCKPNSAHHPFLYSI